MQKIFIHIKSLLVIVLFFTCPSIYAQSTISGTVKDNQDKEIHHANVLLLNASDSTLEKGELTDENGYFIFKEIKAGEYFVQLTHTGMTPYQSASFSMSPGAHLELQAIRLLEKNLHLEEVKITARKPLLEQKIDRMIINVENSITSAGSTALEILERSPGVIVNHQNSTISMNGKDGVVLMMNGKISHAPLSVVVQMLAGMNSANIEKIELITTPPANLDAAGNAGYINIVMKENNLVGTNGSFSLTGGYSKGWISGAGINVNHRKGKINLYGDISYSRTGSFFLVDNYIRISAYGTIYEKDIMIDRIDTTILVNGRLGLDYQVSKRTLAGILLTSNSRHFAQAEKNQSIALKNKLPDTLTTYLNTERNVWTDFGINFNLNHHFKENSSFVLNLDHIRYINDQPVNYFATNYNGDGDFVNNERTRSGKITDIEFWVAALDYKSKMGKNISLETGFKQTISGFQNDISFHRLHANSWIIDKKLSADYRLIENYTAGYISLAIPFTPKTEAKLGVRYEYTNSNLGSDIVKNMVDKRYGQFFPTFYLSHVIDEKNRVNFSFNTRINRPAFTDLAPFTYYLDANTLITGNPALQPSITKAIKGDYMFKSYFLSISYSSEKHSISYNQPEIDSVNLKTALTPRNLENQKSFSAVISIPIRLNDWWVMQYNITGIGQKVNAVYNKKPVSMNSGNISLNGSHQFMLPKKISLELSGFYMSGGLNGIYRFKSFGSLNIGAKKKVLQKSSLSLIATNVLNTMIRRIGVDLPDQNLVSNIRMQFSQSAYKITFVHNFGKEKLKAKRERSTGAEEEKGRVNK